VVVLEPDAVRVAVVRRLRTVLDSVRLENA
jgi:hypothetical protein